MSTVSPATGGTTMTESRGGANGNLAAALVVHYGLGFFWLFVLGAIFAEAGSVPVAVIWALCAVPLWIADSVRMVRAKDEFAQVWKQTFFWWLKTFIAPLFLVIEVLSRRSSAPAPAQPMTPVPEHAWNPHPPSPEPPDDLRRKVEDFARRLGALESELADLRRALSTRAEAPAPTGPPLTDAPPPLVQPPPPVVPPAVREPAPAPSPVAAPTPPPRRPRPPAPPPPPKEPPWWSGLTFADLFTAKVLAWAGGVVTLLGVVFFFVLAVNRGWIGPVARVSLGAIVSTLVFSAGLVVRRRYGHLYYSAYAAVGAGIGGGYATLLAARLRYDLISDWSALILAALIAGVGTATALAWSSEFIAGLGLIGATLAPAAVGLQSGELSAAGTGFAALVFAGTAVVAVGRRWEILLALGVVASLPQGAILIAQSEPTEWDVVAVSAVLWLLFLGSAIALQLRFKSADLASLPASLTLVSALFAGGGVVSQFTGISEGWMLLGVATVYGGLAALLFPRRRDRDLSALLAAVGLAIVAFALADLVSGPALTIAWAAEAAVLAWLARRVDEVRYQVASIAYLAAALIHALSFDAPVRQLYEPSADPAQGGLAFVGFALAGAIVAFYCRPWETARTSAGILAPLQPALDAFRSKQTVWRALAGWTSAAAALYVGSLAILALAEWISDAGVRAAFEWGHVAVIALWGAVALSLLVWGVRDSLRQVRAGALVLLGAVAAQSAFYIAPTFASEPRGVAFLVAAAALLAGSLLDRREPSRERPADTDVLPAVAIAAAGLTIAAFGFADLLSGVPLALAWAAGAAALAWLAHRMEQGRYELAAFAYLAAALIHALAFDAPLRRLYEASALPAEGVAAFIGVALAGAVVAYFCRPWTARPQPPALVGLEPALETFRARQDVWRSIVGWTAALAALYTASLGVLGIAEWSASGSVQEVFEWAHVGVIALWSIAALAVLSAGHRWSLRQLRAGGLVWLGVTLAQVLGYASSFDSHPRDIGFLVVAAALLAGCLVDRLQRRERHVFPIIAVYSLFGFGLACAAAADLAGQNEARGAALLFVVAFYCAIAALVFRRDRDLSTLLWAPALYVATGATGLLLSGTWLVLAWSAIAVATVAIADRSGEMRLQIASLVYLVLAAGHVLALDGPPRDFFESNAHPAGGVASIFFVALATAAFAWYCERASAKRPPADTQGLRAGLVRREPLWKRVSIAATAVLLMYGLSLAILGVAERVGNGSVAARFHAGHSGVSAMWGIIALVALYLGLRKRIVWLQAIGFGLFAVSLAKIFLYDLRFLSSVTRALSFLAVGAVLLLGGFFVQRLGAERGAKPA